MDNAVGHTVFVDDIDNNGSYNEEVVLRQGQTLTSEIQAFGGQSYRSHTRPSITPGEGGTGITLADNTTVNRFRIEGGRIGIRGALDDGSYQVVTNNEVVFGEAGIWISLFGDDSDVVIRNNHLSVDEQSQFPRDFSRGILMPISGERSTTSIENNVLQSGAIGLSIRLLGTADSRVNIVNNVLERGGGFRVGVRIGGPDNVRNVVNIIGNRFWIEDTPRHDLPGEGIVIGGSGASFNVSENSIFVTRADARGLIMRHFDGEPTCANIEQNRITVPNPNGAQILIENTGTNPIQLAAIDSPNGLSVSNPGVSRITISGSVTSLGNGVSCPSY